MVVPPGTEQDPGRFIRLRAVGGAALFVALATLAQLLRQPGVRSWRTVLAEDGAVFLNDAVNHSFGATLLRPYEGYLHVVPRLIAALTAAFPLRYAALLLTGTSALLVSLLALFVWSSSRLVLRSRWSRAVVVAFLLVLPAAGYETNANVNNLHWYLDFACFWVLFVMPRRRGELVVGAVIVTAAALCDPLVGLLLPLAVVGAVVTLRRATSRLSRCAALLVPAGYLAGLVLQLTVGASGRPPRPFVPVSWLDLPGTFGFRVAGSLLVGDRFLVRLFGAYGLAFAYSCLAVAAVAVAGAVAVTRHVVRARVIAAVAYSGVLFAVPLLLRGTSIYLDRSQIRLDGSRYMIVPALLLVVALVLAVDQPGEHARPRRPSIVRPLLIVLVGVLLAVSYSTPSVRQAGPDWRRTVAAAHQRCLRSGGQPAEVSAFVPDLWPTPFRRDEALLPVAPLTPAAPAGAGTAGPPRSHWNVVVACRRLT